MAYDESTYRRRDARVRLARRRPPIATGLVRLGRLPATPDTGRDRRVNGQQRGPSAAALDDVFDDPAHGDPGRDRIAVHAVWEIVLLLAAAAIAFLLYRARPRRRCAARPSTALLVFAAALGLLALGAGLTLRAGAANLALGPIAVAAALHFAEQGDRGLVAAAGAGAGRRRGRRPGASRCSWSACTCPAGRQPGRRAGRHRLHPAARRRRSTVQGELRPDRPGVLPLRRLRGARRPRRPARHGQAGPPRGRAGSARSATRRGAAAALAAAADRRARSCSPSAFAVGRRRAARRRARRRRSCRTGLEWTGLALGAALLGGTSAFGRRGGVFGTLLAVVAAHPVLRYAEVERLRTSRCSRSPRRAIAGGLVVTRLVETLRPAAARRRRARRSGTPARPASRPRHRWAPRSAGVVVIGRCPPSRRPAAATRGKATAGAPPVDDRVRLAMTDDSAARRLTTLRRAGRPVHRGTAGAGVRQGPRAARHQLLLVGAAPPAGRRRRRGRWTASPDAVGADDRRRRRAVA